MLGHHLANGLAHEHQLYHYAIIVEYQGNMEVSERKQVQKFTGDAPLIRSKMTAAFRYETFAEERFTTLLDWTLLDSSGLFWTLLIP